jgi:hypothetical protein
VAGHLADELAVGDAPEADAAVVAAAGEQRTVRADVERANPTFMGVDGADWRGGVAGGIPPGDPSVAAAADSVRAVARRGKRDDPGFMAAGVVGFRAVGEIKALDDLVF